MDYSHLQSASGAPVLELRYQNEPLPLSPEDLVQVCDEISPWNSTITACSLEWDTVLQQAESLQTIYHAQQEALLQMPWLANGTVAQLDTFGQQPVLSGKRSVPDGSEHEQQPPLKSMRADVSREQLQEVEEMEEVIYGEPHFDLGVDEGKHRCSCGKRYTRQFRLRLHIEVHSRNARHPCSVCGMAFRRADSLVRHENNTHKGRKVACPGCQKRFRTDYIPKHLASAQNVKCAVIAEATHQVNNGVAVNTPLAAEDYIIPRVAERRKQTRPQHYRVQNKLPAPDLSCTAEVLEKTLEDGKLTQTRPIVRTTREPCDLCGMPLGPGEKELIDHIGKHSLDFSAKPYKCEQCQISFAFPSDLCLHQEAARKGHCGFAFFHGWERNSECSECCTGHHPPSLDKVELDHHNRMQETLWVWENCQLRAHRATVTRLLAERLQYTEGSRHSFADDEPRRTATSSGVSIGSFDSFRSTPAWMHYHDRIDLGIDAGISDLDLFANSFFDHTAPDDATVGAQVRPESMVLDTTVLDLVKTDLEGELPIASPENINTRGPSMNTSLASAESLYSQQVTAMKAPGGFKTRALGVRYRAKAATRYFLSSHWGEHGTSRVQYVEATVA